MTRVALISDTHLGVKKNSEIFLKSQIKFITDQFIPKLKQENIKDIFWLGDLFDNRNNTNTKILNAVFDLFENHLKDFNVNLLVGNHDCYYNSSIEVNSLKIFKKFENVRVIEQMTHMKIDDKNVILVPWIVDSQDFIREFQKYPCDVCLGHFDITGFQYNKYRKSEDGIQKKLFGRCKKVFSGHFHIRNKQKYEGCDIMYIGSPYQLNRNDMDEERGFAILNFEDLSYENINNEISMKFIKLKFPEKFSKKRITGNIIDVHIDYDDSYNEEKVERYIKRIEEYGPAISPNIFVDNNFGLNGELNPDDCNIGSITELMSEYINSLEIDNKDQIYEILIELYNESKGDMI
jgi:DNA repair exonuclease SbcCD nuclease subunit